MLGSLSPVAKTVVAALLGALTTIHALLDGPNGNVSNSEWVTIGIAFVTALGVYAVPNTPAPYVPAEGEVAGVQLHGPDRGHAQLDGLLWTVLVVLGIIALILYIF